jgi:hypothetical protein
VIYLTFTKRNQEMEQTTRPEDRHAIVCKLIRYEARHPQSGIMALTLRRADGKEVEVLVDAESTLQYLAARFGSADAAVGQKIELSLDVFGFAELGGASMHPK